MKFSRVFRSWKMEVSLITEENKCVVRQAQKRLTYFFTWIKFLHHNRFVGMTFQFFMKDSSHRTSKQPRSRCVFAGRLSERSQNRLTHRVNVLWWLCCSLETSFLFLSIAGFPEVVYSWKNRLLVKNTITGAILKCLRNAHWATTLKKKCLNRKITFQLRSLHGDHWGSWKINKN